MPKTKAGGRERGKEEREYLGKCVRINDLSSFMAALIWARVLGASARCAKLYDLYGQCVAPSWHVMTRVRVYGPYGKALSTIKSG